MNEPTAKEIAQHYSASMDSVNLINGIFAGTMDSQDALKAVQSNQEHLLSMLGKEYWTDEDLTPISTAAKLVTDGVTFPDYVAPDKGPRTTGTFREFMTLFTDAETAAIIALTQTSVAIKLWYDQALAGNVFLGHSKVDGGLSALVSLSIITEARKTEIMATDFDA